MADIDKKLPVLPDKDLMIKADLDLSCLVKVRLQRQPFPPAMSLQKEVSLADATSRQLRVMAAAAAAA